MNGTSRMPVLIAEENRATRNVHRFLLEIAGYRVYETPDASTAIETLRTHPAGMVALLDWEMSSGGCMCILRSLAHMPDAAARHRYVLLAVAPDRLHSRILSLPASISITLLAKPTSMSVLRSAVDGAAATVPAQPASMAR